MERGGRLWWKLDVNKNFGKNLLVIFCLKFIFFFYRIRVLRNYKIGIFGFY